MLLSLYLLIYFANAKSYKTLYGAFDKLARRHKVFKIETIGDCYVSVTGLPDPQPDHAFLMMKFARDALEQSKKILGRLEGTLGPGTTGKLVFSWSFTKDTSFVS